MGPSVQGVYSALGTAGLPVAAAAKFPHLGLPWLVAGHSSGFMFGILPYVVTAAATLGCCLLDTLCSVFPFVTVLLSF